METTLKLPALVNVFNKRKEKLNFQFKNYQLQEEVNHNNRKIYKVYTSGKKKLLFDFYKTDEITDQIGRKIDSGYIKKGLMNTRLPAQIIHEYDCLYVCYKDGIHSFEYQQMR